tara:strand:- start:10954 stop:12030 length:1077 start_codon:yes stop_codon:yes gene_type:complete
MIDHINNFITNVNHYYFALILVSFFIVSFNWPYIIKKINIKKYEASQRIHENEIPRLGGFIIFFFIFIFIFSNSINTYTNPELSLFSFISFCAVPIFLIAFCEDIFQNTSPYLRLLVMFISVSAVIIFSGIQLPTLTIPLIGDFISNSILIYPFFIISIVIFMNGVNMIDGSNGLMPMTALGQLASLIFLSNVIGDYLLINFLFLLALPLVIFAFFNYPFGKIFMGDLGAYLYGYFIAVMTIIFFGRNPVLPSWGAVLILFYPLMEIFFSYYRKIFNDKISPLYPDSYHIHLKMYHLLSNKIKKRRVANGLVMPTLSILWLSPCILITWFYDSLLGIIISLIILIVAYLGFYWSLPRK